MKIERHVNDSNAIGQTKCTRMKSIQEILRSIINRMKNCLNRALHDLWMGKLFCDLHTKIPLFLYFFLYKWNLNRQSTEERWEAFTVQALNDCEEVRQRSVWK